MIQKIIAFFNRNNSKEEAKKSDGLEGQKQDEYIPNQFEIWMFYKKYLDLNLKQIFFKNISVLLSSTIYAREQFVLLDIKNAIMNNDTESFKYYVLEYLGMFIINQVLYFIDTYYAYSYYGKLRQQITKAILLHLFSLDIQYFEETKVTEISEIIKKGGYQISSEINYNKIYSKVEMYIHYGGQLYFIYCQSPTILFGMLIWSLIGEVAQKVYKKKQEKMQKELSTKGDYKDFAFDDIITNIHVIKTFGTEKKEIERLNKIVEENAILQLQLEKHSKIGSMMSTISSSLLKITIIVQIFLGFGLSGNKFNIANSLIDIMGYTYCTTRTWYEIFDLLFARAEDYFSERKKYIGKVMKLFQIKPTIYQDFNDEQVEKTKFEGDITFDNVCFKYPISKNLLSELNQKKQDEEKQKQLAKPTLDKTDTNNSQQNLIQDDISSSSSEDLNPQKSLPSLDKSKSSKKVREYVLENVSFQIKKGQFVAFVGTSGSGKSTIVKLLQRFYDINSGSILFDGKNVKDVSLSQLRKSIGLVSQEQSLFDNDIEYNITYGCENRKYTQEELRRACDMSGVSEFVFDEKRFPKGLKTLVGAKGMKLSGGQKQRIAIARALIKKPKILILDEATSALDSESEHIVQLYIDKLVSQRGMTIITVAHRLSTILKSDKIFVMKGGQIRESGTHTELLAKDGIYKKLVHHQINFQQNIEGQ